MKRTLAVVGAVLGMFALGCAMIIEGTEEEVSVNSEPSNATVTVDGNPKGKTPTTVKLDKGSSHTIKIEKSGYSTETITLSTQIDPLWLILDIALFYTLVPLAVDAITGAWYKFDQDEIHVRLQQSASDSSDGPHYEIVMDGATRIAAPDEGVSPMPLAPYEPADGASD